MDGFSYLCIGTALSLVLLAVAAAVLLVRVKPALEYQYLLLGTVFGILFLFLVPPYMTPDENVHICASYYVSNVILGVDPGELSKNAITMRQCDAELSMYMEEKRENYNYYLEQVFQGAGDTSLTTVHYPIQSISRPWVYTVGALGIAFARLLGQGAVQTVLMGSFFNTVFFVLAVFYSIKKIPFGKMVLFTVALFPMTLQQTSSLSYDNLLLAAFFVLTALSLHWRFGGQRVRITEAAVCLAADAALLGVKGGAYAVFLFLPILLQLQREMFTKKRLLAGGLILLAAIGVCVLVFGGRAAMYFRQVTDPALPGAYIPYAEEYGYSLYELLHPATRLLSILWDTLWSNGRLYVLMMAGKALGWLHILMPTWLMALYFLVLLGAALPKEGEAVVNGYHRGVIWGMCLFCTALIFVSMLLYWTPKSADTIQGIQGRYFLPYLPLAAICLGGNRVRRRRLRDWMLVVALLVLGTFSCWGILAWVA